MRVADLVLVVWMAAPLLRAQSAPSPRFEVASVKLSPDAVALKEAGMILHTARTMTNTRVDLGNIPLPYLIALAYRIKPEEVEGPGWMSEVHLDVLANLPPGANKEEIPEMLQALLMDRIGLKAHFQTADKPVYALVVGSGGAKLKPAEAPDPNYDGRLRMDHGIGYGSGELGPFRFTIADGASHFDFASMTMSNLAAFLSQNKQQVVLNETGIEGDYQIHLDIPLDSRLDLISTTDPGAALAASDPGGNLLVASVEKLGLKLTRKRAAVSRIIVDQVKKVPTAN